MFISFIKTYKYIISLIIFIISLLYLFYYKYNYESFAGVAFNTASWPRRLNTFGLPLDKQREALLYCADKLNTEELVDKCPTQYPNPANFFYLTCLQEIAVSEGELDAGLPAVFAFGTSCQSANNYPENPARIFCHPDLDTIFIGTNCAIDCVGSYGEFSQCSETCGGGTRTKTYEITTPAQLGGSPCPTAITEPCNTQPCPINCVGSYGEFNECSATCGGGTRTKTYEITTPAQHGGAPCPTSPQITEPCNTQPCPINCVGSYGEFNECSATCGGGTRTKTYEITTPAQHGGAPCPTSPPINETCNTQPCPIDCIGTFSTIEKCSKECGGGKETIKYVISQEGKNGGKECEYTDGYTDRIDCNIFECANNLDTPYYKRFKPLEYNKNRAYYWRRDKLVEEGIRRNQYDLQKIHNLQTSFENETDEKKKKELQDELDLYKWRDNILETKDNNTGLSRDKRDIITDYEPEEIGLPRVWMERHSHIPDYSY